MLRFELLSARHWPRNSWRIAAAVKVSSTYQVVVVIVVEISGGGGGGGGYVMTVSNEIKTGSR